MKQQRYGKIVQLSGGGATKPMPRTSAYAASKAAVVRFAETLAEEVRDFGISVNAIAPGAMNTRMLDEMLAAGPERIGQVAYAAAIKQKEKGGDSPLQAAACALFLAATASDGISGKLISAVWDNWRDFPAHKDALARSDVYTLRRIAGRDRGMNWGDK
jgi:NAD(P)-dependent dehydrogenase (short-subunit alcohol dehydrogenase family)